MIGLPASSTDELKRCCASAYQLDVVPALLGESYHPGGLALTRRLARAIGLRAGMRVAELASGPGTTAMALAEEFGARVVGLELGAGSAARAARSAAARGLAGQVGFVVADIEAAPLADGSMDAVVCECAFCTFPDKPQGAAAMARLLAPGGRVGISDVVVEPGGLPAELQGVAAWIGCLAGALPARGYELMLRDAGLLVTMVEAHDHALTAMIDAVESRLLALILAGLPVVAAIDPGQVRAVAATARTAVAEGAAGYVLLVAEKV